MTGCWVQSSTSKGRFSTLESSICPLIEICFIGTFFFCVICCLYHGSDWLAFIACIPPIVSEAMLALQDEKECRGGCVYVFVGGMVGLMELLCHWGSRQVINTQQHIHDCTHYAVLPFVWGFLFCRGSLKLLSHTGLKVLYEAFCILVLLGWTLLRECAPSVRSLVVAILYWFWFHPLSSYFSLFNLL